MNDVTRKILDYSQDIAASCDAAAIVVYADVFPEREDLGRFTGASADIDVVLVTRSAAEEHDTQGADVIRVPDIKLTRVGQIKVAVLLALSRGRFRVGDRLVCLTGIAESGVLDTMMLMEVGEEFEMFGSVGISGISAEVRPDVFDRVLDTAVSLGNEGREGKPVGTTFVVGDSDAVLERSHPMVLNPFKGYPEEERSILDAAVQETVKEFSTIDGAFVVRADGVVEAAGVFLQTEAQSVEVPRGLGARHKSAAAITALTDAVAVVVSESSGNVSVFRDGKVVIEIEKPRPIGRETARQRRFFGRQEPGIDVSTDETED